MIVVVSIAALLAPSGSGVAALTLAAFTIVPPSRGAVARTLKAADSPAARLVRTQTIRPAASGSQVHPLPEPEAFAIPSGSVSVTVIVPAGSGPAFETVRIHPTASPAPTGSSVSLSVSERSACGTGTCTIVCSVAASFAWFGSTVEETTDAAFTRVAAARGAVAVSVMAGALPGSRLGRAHVIVPAAAVTQTHPAPAAAAPETPAGSVSVTVTPTAKLGPALETASV